jgi:hypothetical protein
MAQDKLDLFISPIDEYRLEKVQKELELPMPDVLMYVIKAGLTYIENNKDHFEGVLEMGHE